ncbi:hypothetical protein ACIRO1_45960 [Streptomyces sp. NPDC102381]|uniref:hypothetical protein n=1 Tax=Streptomyces sp. NPDC102381 TaxID=3366164 RepID=UPI0038177FF3
MTNVLVVYDRAAGRLVSLQEFARRKDALAARFRAEREQGDHKNIEVVVLTARSRDDLHKTHARYFRTLDQLAGNH